MRSIEVSRAEGFRERPKDEQPIELESPLNSLRESGDIAFEIARLPEGKADLRSYDEKHPSQSCNLLRFGHGGMRGCRRGRKGIAG